MPPSDKPPRLTVGLLWHSLRSDNLGVGALALGNIALVREAACALGAEVDFVVIGPANANSTQKPVADAQEMVVRAATLPPPGGVYRAAKQCDLVLDITAGDSFTDIYGPKRFFYMVATKLLVAYAGTPLILSPQTIGPFTKAWARAPAALALRKARHVFTRDELSVPQVRELADEVSPIVSTDVAFVMPYERHSFPLDGKVRVGLNVSGLLYNGGYTGRNELGLKDDYVAVVDAVIATLTRRPDVEVHFIGHVNSTGMAVEDDYRVCARLAERTDGAVLAPRFGSPIEAKGYIAGMDFFAGARMHATIAAFSTGVPVVPMAYSRKFAGLFGALGYAEGVDLKKQTREEIADAIGTAFDGRVALKQEVERRRVLAQSRLEPYRAALRDVLAEALTSRAGEAA